MRDGQYPKNPADFGLRYQLRSFLSTLSKGVIKNEKETTHLLQQQKRNKIKNWRKYSKIIIYIEKLYTMKII